MRCKSWWLWDQSFDRRKQTFTILKDLPTTVTASIILEVTFINNARSWAVIQLPGPRIIATATPTRLRTVSCLLHEAILHDDADMASSSVTPRDCPRQVQVTGLLFEDKRDSCLFQSTHASLPRFHRSSWIDKKDPGTPRSKSHGHREHLDVEDSTSCTLTQKQCSHRSWTASLRDLWDISNNQFSTHLANRQDSLGLAPHLFFVPQRWTHLHQGLSVQESILLWHDLFANTVGNRYWNCRRLVPFHITASTLVHLFRLTPQCASSIPLWVDSLRPDSAPLLAQDLKGFVPDLPRAPLHAGRFLKLTAVFERSFSILSLLHSCRSSSAEILFHKTYNSVNTLLIQCKSKFLHFNVSLDTPRVWTSNQQGCKDWVTFSAIIRPLRAKPWRADNFQMSYDLQPVLWQIPLLALLSAKTCSMRANALKSGCARSKQQLQTIQPLSICSTLQSIQQIAAGHGGHSTTHATRQFKGRKQVKHYNYSKHCKLKRLPQSGGRVLAWWRKNVWSGCTWSVRIVPLSMFLQHMINDKNSVSMWDFALWTPAPELLEQGGGPFILTFSWNLFVNDTCDHLCSFGLDTWNKHIDYLFNDRLWHVLLEHPMNRFYHCFHGLRHWQIVILLND